MRLFAFVFFFVFLQSALFAQGISGTIKDADNNLLNAATVSLLNARDSSILKLNATDKKGAYRFENITSGNYIIMATSVGFGKSYSAPMNYNGNDHTMDALQLRKATTELAGVVVTAKKPLIEVKADKMIVNVEGTINATGNDGLELLRRSPGVMIDKDDNISMAGKTGVAVYIDGRPSPLTGADLANFLRSLQSSSIESIELITNPSAKYEASGNAGIINIRLKKDKALGTNGTLTAGYNVGKYGKYNAGISLNHRSKKANYFGNYNFSDGNYHTELGLYRAMADTIFDQNSTIKAGRTSHNFKAGADYYINSKHTIGIMFNGSLMDMDNHSSGPMTITPRGASMPSRILEANSVIESQRNNYNANANYKYADTAGRQLNIDLDYGRYENATNQFIPNIYYSGDHQTELSRNIYRMITPTDINIYSVKADYEHNFLKGKLSYGGKVGFVETFNKFNRFNVTGNTETWDKKNANDFNYTENVNALYVNYNRQYKGLMVQVGLRGENTNSEGISTSPVSPDSTVKRSYTDLFPSAAFTFNKNPMSQWSLTYSRRIDRPNYSNLNPFRFLLNDYTYQQGNPFLTPQYTNSIGLTHTYKYKLNTKVNYSYIKDLFAQIMDTTEGSKAFQITKNLATQQIWGLNISYPFIYKSLTVFANLSSNYSTYKANFGGGGRDIKASNFNTTLFTQSSYKFAKTWTAELSTLYLSPFVWEGMFKGKSLGFVDLGLQKSILKGRGTLKASASDIFRTMRFKGTANYAGTETRIRAAWEAQQFKLNFTYRFGSAQIKAARQRKTGAEDENSRTGEGGKTMGQ
ncbi:MAG TPA: TonB-dependent receptor [Niabella sp.]|nr:TonB-dependent receptor [Niabella sp.]HOZ98208.1 TonB-dependent receptor [Niabella sp.]HQW16249.1 TonB-dependent receptor [Niabella sp.]HQX21464.1 TonB-dependent receptor [Niabella sp.]HQX42516.1 TonB-dependent receptor [Niabella sp.]